MRKFTIAAGLTCAAAVFVLTPVDASAQPYGWPDHRERHHDGGWSEHRAYGPPGYRHHAPVYDDYHHHHHCRWVVENTWHGHHRARVCD